MHAQTLANSHVSQAHFTGMNTAPHKHYTTTVTTLSTHLEHLLRGFEVVSQLSVLQKWLLTAVLFLQTYTAARTVKKRKMETIILKCVGIYLADS